MKRLACASLCLLLLAVGGWPFAAPATTAARRKSNIIFLHADDLGYGDLSVYGQRQFKTPHLDRDRVEGCGEAIPELAARARARMNAAHTLGPLWEAKLPHITAAAPH